MYIALVTRLLLAIVFTSSNEALNMYLGSGAVTNLENVSTNLKLKELFLSKRRILEEGRLDRLNARIHIESESYDIGVSVYLNASKCSKNIIYPSFGVYGNCFRYFSQRLQTSFTLALGLSIAILKRDNLLFSRESRRAFFKKIALQQARRKFNKLKDRVKAGISEVGVTMPELVTTASSVVLNTTNTYLQTFVEGAVRVIAIACSPSTYGARINKLQKSTRKLVSTSKQNIRSGLGALQAHLTNTPPGVQGRVILLGPYLSICAQFKGVSFYLQLESELFVDDKILDPEAESRYKWPVMFSLIQAHIGVNFKIFGF